MKSSHSDCPLDLGFKDYLLTLSFLAEKYRHTDQGRHIIEEAAYALATGDGWKVYGHIPCDKAVWIFLNNLSARGVAADLLEADYRAFMDDVNTFTRRCAAEGLERYQMARRLHEELVTAKTMR